MSNVLPGKTAKLVDSNGEIIRSVDLDNEYIRSKKSDEAYRRIASGPQDKRHFSFANMENVKNVISSVKTVHCGYLLILQCYMEFKTGRITLKRKDITKVLGTSPRTFMRFLKEVMENGIIIKKGKNYYVNSDYHFRSTPKNERVIKVFYTPIRELKGKFSAVELGFLYKLLPYVHYETNIICANPFDLPEDVRFLNKKEIAELVGLEEKRASKLMGKFSKAGIIAETISEDDKRERLYTLNPYYFYRKVGQPEDTLCELFGASPDTT